jgi:hypothetical protein
MTSREPPCVSFLTPLIANAMAPVTESITAAARSAMVLPATEVFEIPCPRPGCGGG